MMLQHANEIETGDKILVSNDTVCKFFEVAKITDLKESVLISVVGHTCHWNYEDLIWTASKSEQLSFAL